MEAPRSGKMLRKNYLPKHHAIQWINVKVSQKRHPSVKLHWCYCRLPICKTVLHTPPSLKISTKHIAPWLKRVHIHYENGKHYEKRNKVRMLMHRLGGSSSVLPVILGPIPWVGQYVTWLPATSSSKQSKSFINLCNLSSPSQINLS